MNKILKLCGGLAIAALASSSALAVTASTLSSFGGREEPTVIYRVSSDSFANDSYVNITDRTGGRFRMELRYRKGDWWDGDRNTTSEDRQRAEVKVLGSRQLPNQTFDYQSTWRTNNSFLKGTRFCHIFQVKGYGGGDIGAPLVTTSIDSNSAASVRYCSGTQSGLTAARTFGFTIGSTITVRIRLKVSTSSGELRASVNGDSLAGKTNLPMYRPNAPEYQPKWGLYRGCDSNQPFGDNYLEHSAVSANRIN